MLPVPRTCDECGLGPCKRGSSRDARDRAIARLVRLSTAYGAGQVGLTPNDATALLAEIGTLCEALRASRDWAMNLPIDYGRPITRAEIMNHVMMIDSVLQADTREEKT